MNEQQQMQEELQQDLQRIYAYIENHIAPKDRALVLWAFGLSEPKRGEAWAEMAVSDR